MAKETTMPKLSDTMTEGLFAAWRKNVGDRIERGDIIAEVETDKAVMELEAFASGVLIRTFVQGGEQIPVGTVLGLIGDAAELADEKQVQAPAPAPAPAPQPQPAAAAPRPEVQQPVSLPEHHDDQHHDKASPLVRRMARDHGIDLSQVQGTGPDGRITQDDLVTYTTLQSIRQAPAVAVPATDVRTEDSPPYVTSSSRGAAIPMRQAIAAAVSHSWQTIPHFSVSIEIDMDACREVVAELKGGEHPVGYNALMLKACAMTLKDFPLLLPAESAGENRGNISFAVALEDGLLMPVIRGCDTLTVAAISRETARLADKCRQGKLTSEEMSGGLFSVSNLGMYGIDDFTALIMPGQVAILAAGAVAERPVIRSGAVTAAATVRVTLCSDHRVVDGAYAARFLAALKSNLEKPVSLLV